MENKYTQMSLIEIALEIMEASKAPLNIYDLIAKTLEKKGIVDEDGSIAAKLYTDLTISSKFVYMGDDLWDLKSRQSLDQFDKDGSSFNSKDDEYEDEAEEEDDLEDDDLLEDEDEEDEDSDDEEDEDSDEDLDDEDNYDDTDEEDHYDDDDNYDDTDEEDHYDDDDEDKYNQIMDDYEDLYED